MFIFFFEAQNCLLIRKKLKLQYLHEAVCYNSAIILTYSIEVHNNLHVIFRRV
jgi:hypothetical protein